jgi:hypothetical protein
VPTRCVRAVAENVDPQMPLKRFSRQSVREDGAKSSLPLRRKSEVPESGWVLGQIRPHRPTATCSRSITKSVAGAPGFEPGITRPKPVALPLGHAPSRFFGSRPLARRANRLDQWPRWRAARFAVLPASGPLGNGSACAASKNFAQDPPARCCGPARPRLYTVLFQPKSLVEAECSAAW